MHKFRVRLKTTTTFYFYSTKTRLTVQNIKEMYCIMLQSVLCTFYSSKNHEKNVSRFPQEY